MWKRLKKMMRKSRGARLKDAQLAELRAVVASLVQRQRAVDDEDVNGTALEDALMHAARARVDLERVESLYGSIAMRLASVEKQLERMGAASHNSNSAPVPSGHKQDRK